MSTRKRRAATFVAVALACFALLATLVFGNPSIPPDVQFITAVVGIITWVGLGNIYIGRI